MNARTTTPIAPPSAPAGGRIARIRAWSRYAGLGVAVAMLAIVLVLGLAGVEAAARTTAVVFVSAVIAWTLFGMIRAVLQGHFGLDVLAVVAMVATLAVGEYVASLIIVVMLLGGEALEDVATRRATRELSALLDRTPQLAHVVAFPGRADEHIRDVPVDQVAVGDVLLVRPGEVVPVDGTLESPSGTFDESSITGESLPATHASGDEILSGSTNGSHAVLLRTTRAAADSQYQQIVALVREAQDSKAPVVRLADRFAVPFTAVSLTIAGAAWGISGDPTRFAEVLVLATPCPLLIAAPVAFLGGLSRSARAGVIIKGGAVIEQLARTRSAAFDKTGTLTEGRPELVAVRPAGTFGRDEVLRLAASVERYSGHVLAAGIVRAAEAEGMDLPPCEEAEEHATNGVSGVVDSHRVTVGKFRFVDAITTDAVRATPEAGEAVAYVAVDGRFAGTLVLADRPRPEAGEVIARLRQDGVSSVVMLTGDARETAEAVAADLGIDRVHAELLPAEKVHLAARLEPRPIIMVGDGVNDAPVLAAADVGVAMGARGATAAGQAADVVLLKDSLTGILDAVGIAKHTLRTAFTAILIGIALSVVLMLVATTGLIPAVAGALVQELVDVTTILFALGALTGPRRVRPGASRSRHQDVHRRGPQGPGGVQLRRSREVLPRG